MNMATVELEKAKSILPLDYDEDDSEEDEDDDELFDNSKVDWRVKGNLLRGKDFTVSDNGNCPRCQSNIFVFVILDELFPMGDMPEILYNLLAKGKAVLWSSQDKQACKKPPTFMCRGFCPADSLGAGFNINWDTVNLTKLLKDLLKLNLTKAKRKLQLKEKDEDDEDVNEKDIIRVMLAREKEKATKDPAVNTAKEGLKTETSTSTIAPSTSTTVASSVTVASSSTTAVVSTTSTTSAASKVEYPVSKDGSCPYCSSTNVRYIILVKDTTKDSSLPPTLDLLLKQGKAFKMAKGANNPPSFQCCSCTYGFNLDWSSTNLKKIFKLDDSAPATTTAATKSTTVGYQFSTYPPPAQPPAYQNTAYAPYAYPTMYYSTTPTAYSYPTAGYGIPAPGVPPMHGLPLPFAGSPPPPPPFSGHPPPPPFGRNPQLPLFAGNLPSRGPQMPPRVPNTPPNSVYGDYGQPYLGDYNQRPSRPLPRPPPARLRVPRGPLRGRFNYRNARWHGPQPHQTYHESHDQWSTYSQEQVGTEETEGATEVNEEPVVDQQAADRFEKLLNQIDGENEDADEHQEHIGEDEKPPGEESQAEFEVTAFTNAAEKTTKQPENARKNGSEKEKSGEKLSDNSSEVTSVSQPKSESIVAVNSKSSLKVEQPEKMPSGVGSNVPSSDSAQLENVPSAVMNHVPSLKPEPSEEITLGVTSPGQAPSSFEKAARSKSVESKARHSKGELEAFAQPTDVSGKVEAKNKVTSEVESQESEEVEMSPATGSRKTTRSRKRLSTGRKKATNTRGGKKKKTEKEVEDETSIEDVEEETKEGKTAKVQNSKDRKQEVKEEEPQPTRRITRARAQKLKN